MEELQMEVLISLGSETRTFATSFVDPFLITIEDKLKFENLFELDKAQKISGPVY